MPWTTPTLRQLQERISADLSSRLLDGGSLLSRSVLRVLATTWAGAVHVLHLFLAWCFRQCFPDTAEGEHLQRWARIWAITRKAGARAEGHVLFTGAVGRDIPGGTLLRDARGVFYRVMADVTLENTSENRNDDGTAKAPVQAVETGATGNVESGSSLQLVSPIAGLDMGAEVLPGSAAQGLTGGADTEGDASLLRRLLDKIQSPPHGGNAQDYVQWAREVPGVTRAWSLPRWMGLGTVGITFVCDDIPKEAGGPLPGPEMVQRVQEKMDKAAPVTAAVVVFSPEALPVDVEVIISPYNQGLATRIAWELTDLFVREGAAGQVLPRSHIAEAVSVTPGEFDHVLLLPASNIVPAAHQLPVLGVVTIRGAYGEGGAA